MTQENVLPLPFDHVYGVHQMADLVCADAERRQLARDAGIPLGPTTGIRGLDDLLAGCMEPGLYTVNGVPGMGKTALALQIAADCGCPAVFLSCEMAPLELMRRLVARVSHRSLRALRTEPLANVLSAVAEARDKLNPDLTILDATTTPWPMDELRRAVRLYMAESKFGVVIVDSLHAWVMSVADAASTEYDALNRATMALRQMAHDYGISIMQVAERNRASMASGGLHSSAGSRRIEFASDVYLDLQKAEEQPPVHPGFTPPVRVMVTAEKNRFGPAGVTLSLLFDGRHQSFEEEA